MKNYRGVFYFIDIESPPKAILRGGGDYKDLYTTMRKQYDISRERGKKYESPCWICFYHKTKYIQSTQIGDDWSFHLLVVSTCIAAVATSSTAAWMMLLEAVEEMRFSKPPAGTRPELSTASWFIQRCQPLSFLPFSLYLFSNVFFPFHLFSWKALQQILK